MVEIRIAGWESRLFAWIIDIIPIYALVAVIESAISTLTGWNAPESALPLPDRVVCNGEDPSPALQPPLGYDRDQMRLHAAGRCHLYP